jgi:F1F0 ATPase subunit 2
MPEMPAMIVAVLTGMLLGGVFFGGLWWTVRKGLSPSQAASGAAFWFLGSFLIRTTITVGGFYLVGRGDWHRMIGCLAGFLLGRLVVVRLTRRHTRTGAAPEC